MEKRSIRSEFMALAVMPEDADMATEGMCQTVPLFAM
jgi:hypothetical protein